MSYDEQRLLTQLERDVQADDGAGPGSHQLWDTECLKGDLDTISAEVAQRHPGTAVTKADLAAYEPGGQDRWRFPIDREIHQIDFMTRDDSIWKLDPNFRKWNLPLSRDRQNDAS